MKTTLLARWLLDLDTSMAFTSSRAVSKVVSKKAYRPVVFARHWWLQVVAILAAGHKLPFAVEAVKLDLPELQASRAG